MRWTKETTTLVRTELFIDDVFKNPEEYVDSSTDLLIMELKQKDESSVLVMVGLDEDCGSFYIVLEDDETSRNFYPDPETNQCLYSTYIDALVEWGLLIKEEEKE